MNIYKFKRVPNHIGIIPDGNRRWAVSKGLEKQDGYNYGVNPGLDLYDAAIELGIKELTFYGFTQDNTKRPSLQTKSFSDACVKAVEELTYKDAEILVVGNTQSGLFPKELAKYTKRTSFGKRLIKVNFLINYGWNWDLNYGYTKNKFDKNMLKSLASADISRIDLIIRWGGRRRLSGFLPVQSIYSDFYIVDEMWPDFSISHLYEALEWYQDQDITLGG